MKKEIYTRRSVSRFLTASFLTSCVMTPIWLEGAPAEAASIRAREKTPPFVAKLKPLLEAAMKQLQDPGAIILADLPGEGEWEAALGTSTMTGSTPINRRSYMRIGSITKTFVATVILQFYDEGKLKLDDPVGKYLPEVPNGNQITLRELLNMTSGLFNYTEDTDFVQAVVANPERVWTPQELLAFAFKHPPYFPPGGGWHYSNTNYIVLGLLIERISHQPAERVIWQQIFRPLRMFTTNLPPRSSAAIPDPHPHGYAPLTSTGPFLDATGWNASWGWTAGAAFSTLHDLEIWARALAIGTLLRPETQKERLQWIPVNAATGYGLGIANFGGLIGHDGEVPGFQSFMGYIPETREKIIVLTNLSTALDGTPPADALTGIIAQVLAGSTSTAAKNMRLQSPSGQPLVSRIALR